MYMLIFGGFIIFLDWINFIIDPQKKKKSKKITEVSKNFLLRYFHACDQRNRFIKSNHHLCIVGIIFSVIAQIIYSFQFPIKDILLEYITLFLICFLFYLSGYQVARAMLLQYEESKNTTTKFIFLITFIFVILALVVVEAWILIQYLFFKFNF